MTQELLTLPAHLHSPAVVSRISVAQFVVFLCSVLRITVCLLDHFKACPSYDVWLLCCYLQILNFSKDWLVYYIVLNANTWNLLWSRTWFTHLSIVGCHMLSRNCLPFRNTRVHHVFLPVLVVHVVKLHVFTLLDPCCYVRHDFRAKTMFDSSWLLLYVFIYVY